MSTVVTSAAPAATSISTELKTALTELTNRLSESNNGHLLQSVKHGPGKTSTTITTSIGGLPMVLECEQRYIWFVIKSRENPEIIIARKLLSYDLACQVLEHFAQLALDAVSVLNNDHHYNGGLFGDDLQQLMQGYAAADDWVDIAKQLKALPCK